VIAALLAVIGAAGPASHPALAQREHTRLTPNRSTTVTEAQAVELTLTLTDAAVREVQVWVRTAGVIDDDHRTLTSDVAWSDAGLLQAGQRARAFSPASRSRMHQAFVASVVRRGERAIVRTSLPGDPLEASRYYVLEIVTPAGDLFSVPNEAIIVSGDQRLVYVQESGGYVPREITTGIQGELYTQVLEGLTPGEQVVTFGSFFIDADYKLKGP
jgi:hypothetical protein